MPVPSKLRNLWENMGGVISYVYMLGSSLVAIALSLIILWVRTALSRVVKLDKAYLGDEVEDEADEESGKKVYIFYGTQTGTAKVK